MKIGVLVGNDEMVYGSVGVFNNEIINAFKELGHDVKACCKREDFYDRDFTIGIGSFGYFFGDTSTFDYLKKPHFAWIIDNPIECNFSYVKSDYLYYITIDMEHQMILEQLGKKSFFLPLGTKKYSGENENKEYDVVFSGGMESLDGIEKSWKEYPKAYDALIKLKDACIEDMSIPPYAKICNMDIFKNQSFEVRKFLYAQINRYLRCYKRKVVLNSIKTHEIHIFGPIRDEQILSKDNIICHGSLSYNDTYELFAKSKIVLNVTPNFMQGSHDRELVAAEHGAVVFTDENRYLRDNFKNNALMFYDYKRLNWLDKKIDKILLNDELRIEMVKNSRNIIEQKFTWTEKCRQIIEFAEYALSYTKWFL